MNAKPLHKQIKSVPVILLIFILVNVCLSIFNCFSSVGETKILEVNVKGLKQRTYRHIDVGENTFQTGTEGKLYWKVKNIQEAFLVALSDRDGAFNFYDIFYFLILDIALFIMVYRIDEKTIFTQQIIFGIYLIASSVIIYPVITITSYKICGWSIETLTSNSFTSQLRDLNIVKYQFIAYLIIFMLPLIKKAKILQQEQDLTI